MTSSAFPLSADLGGAQLRGIAGDEQRPLAEALAAMPPWGTLGISADDLARFFGNEDPGTYRYGISADNGLAGVLCVRFPWLKGPYIELLAMLPGHQGHGLGTKALSFVETEARRAATRNVWVCASEFNGSAQRFYKRNGFVEVGSLPGLVADGFSETLLRKPLT